MSYTAHGATKGLANWSTKYEHFSRLDYSKTRKIALQSKMNLSYQVIISNISYNRSAIAHFPLLNISFQEERDKI